MGETSMCLLNLHGVRITITLGLIWIRIMMGLESICTRISVAFG